MRFCSLGSGSSGNATVIEAGDDAGRISRVLVDCGFSLRELTARLARRALAPDAIDAVFITHEHSDHVGCALTLARRHAVPLWMSHGTWQAIGEPDLPDSIRIASDAQRIAVGCIELTPFGVPHDAQEPLQLRCSARGLHLGILTDAGSITPHLLAHLQACDALLLESNHDPQMLAASRYPPWLKRRIAGELGHLSNETSARILAQCLHGGLKHLVAAHLSQQNNSPEQARKVLGEIVQGTLDEIVVADPRIGTDWLDLG